MWSWGKEKEEMWLQGRSIRKGLGSPLPQPQGPLPLHIHLALRLLRELSLAHMGTQFSKLGIPANIPPPPPPPASGRESFWGHG